MNNENVQAVTDTDIDAELNALLADATDTENDAGETVEVQLQVEASNDDLEGLDLEQIEREAQLAASKEEAYAEQVADEPEAPIEASVAVAAAAAAATAAAAAAAVAPKTRAPRVSRAAGAKPSQVLAATMSDEALLKAAMLLTGDEESEDNVKALNDTIDSLAKKVGDKAVNLLRYASEPRKLQNYTRLGLELLVRDGEVTSKSLTDHLKAAKYTEGTARSQANQIMSLFPALKVAARSGKTLTLNSESTLLGQFKAATA